MRFSRGVSWLACAVLVVGLAACAGDGGQAEIDAARQVEWEWLTEAKQQLDDKRLELVEARAMLAVAGEEAEVAADEPTEEGAEGVEEGEVALTPEELAAQVEVLDGEVAELTEAFGTRLVGFINTDPLIADQEPTERQMAAIRLKSDEDIVMAQEYIDIGGDYRRAIEIYRTALMVDPDNEKIHAALAAAEADRFMSEERFALAKKGMSEEEVRAILGQVNLRNIRPYPDKGVTAWFYATAEGGAAAAVWFREDKKSGESRVYQLKFDAVKPGEDREEPE